MRRLDFGGFTVLPTAGLRYAHLFDGSYSETGASGFNLAVSSRDANSLQPFIGARATTSFVTDGGMQLIPKMGITYSHEMFDTPASVVQVGGGSFTVHNLAPSRDRLTLGGGVTAKLGNHLAFYADYHATVPTGNFFQQTVEAGLSVKF